MKIKNNKEHSYRTKQLLEKLTKGDPKKLYNIATKYLAKRDKELIELQKINIMQDLIMFSLLVEVENFSASIRSVVQDKMVGVKIEFFGKHGAQVVEDYENTILKYIDNRLDRIRKVISYCRDNEPYNGLTFEQIQLIINDSLIKDHYKE